MLIKKPADIKSAEITPREIYLNRRQFITSASAAVVTTGAALAGLDILRPSARAYAGEKLANVKKSSYSIDEKQNSFKDITSYNNFYELGVDKGDPAGERLQHGEFRGPATCSGAVRNHFYDPQTETAYTQKHSVDEGVRPAPCHFTVLAVGRGMRRLFSPNIPDEHISGHHDSNGEIRGAESVRPGDHQHQLKQIRPGKGALRCAFAGSQDSEILFFHNGINAD